MKKIIICKNKIKWRQYSSLQKKKKREKIIIYKNISPFNQKGEVALAEQEYDQTFSLVTN